jgi:hypothetical protein
MTFRPNVFSLLLFGATVCAACAPNALTAQSTNGCRAADTVEVPRRLDYFRTLVNSSDPDRDTVRKSLGIVSAPTSKVNLVTTRTTCVNLITALNTKRSEPNAIRQIWAFTLGGGDYAVEDPAIAPAGEFMPVYIFDKTFKFKNILAPW